MTERTFTLKALLDDSCSKFGNHLSLNFVQNGNRTYKDLRDDVISVSNMLLEMGVSKGDKVAIFSANMPNWGITQFAIGYIGAILVPILPGFSNTEIDNILRHSEVKVLFVSKLLYKTVADINTDFLKHRVLMNNFIEIPDGYPVDDIQKLDCPHDFRNLKPIPDCGILEDDTASIIYTSGTTGFSKGVELSNRNIVWNAQQCSTIQHIDTTDRFLSILPMAHTYENTLGLLLPLMFGASVFYLDRVPTPKLLVPAMQKIKPTCMLSVPLVIEKIYKQQILPKFNSNKIIKFIYSMTLGRKVLNFLAGKKLLQTFGGEIKFFGVGGSKLDPIVERFLHEAKFPYAIGYGLTETAPMTAGNPPYKTFLQSVGEVMDGVSIKINEPNEKGEGEIWIKGPNIMKGYYKRPELTKEAITSDGWFKTGDLGHIARNGVLSIRGRLKTMILGSSGENIYPEEIESIINNFRFVEESLVVEYKGKLVAMVHFNMDELEKQVEKFKNQASSYKKNISDFIEEEKQSLFEYVNSKVNNFSKLQLVVVQAQPFEKTPTQKIKRFLYQNLPELMNK